MKTLSEGEFCRVLVVGAGPVGLLVASELTEAGIDTRVVDASAGPSGHCKALAIQARTLELFEQLGIIDDALNAGLKVRAANLYRDGVRIHRFEIDPSPKPDQPYPFVLSLPQSETERILQARLGILGGAVEWDTSLVDLEQDGEAVYASLAEVNGRIRRVAAEFVIGCDGAHSLVRTLTGMHFEGEILPQTYILADVDLEADLAPDESHRFMASDNVLVVWPISGDGRFFLTGPERVLHDMTDDPTLEDVQALCDEILPLPIKLRNSRWLARYRVHTRLVDKYRMGRVFVAGDAAHVHPTTGAQGLNTGLQDAHNLCWKLALVLSGKGQVATLLDSYEAERRPVAEQVLRTSETVFRSEPADPTTARRQIVSALSQVAVTYRGSPIVVDQLVPRPEGERLSAGDRAPDGRLALIPDGTPTRFFDLIRRRGHSLFLFGSSAEDFGPEEVAAVRSILVTYTDQVQVYVVRCEGRSALPSMAYDGAYVDQEGILHRAYGVEREPLLVLIRPDGYIGFIAPASNLDALSTYLGRLFQQHDN